MKKTFYIALILTLLFLTASCGGDEDTQPDGDKDSDPDFIYIPPAPDGDNNGADGDLDIEGEMGEQAENAEQGNDGDIDSQPDGDDEQDVDDSEYECDPYNAVGTCPEYDIRRYCEPPGYWQEESCAPGACVTDGASAWCVGKEDPDGDQEMDIVEIDSETEIEEQAQTVEHNCGNAGSIFGPLCTSDENCIEICLNIDVFCYACDQGVCGDVPDGQGTCTPEGDGDLETDFDSELDAVETQEIEVEPEAETECQIGVDPWYCTGSVMHYCDFGSWFEIDCSPQACIEEGIGASCENPPAYGDK